MWVGLSPPTATTDVQGRVLLGVCEHGQKGWKSISAPYQALQNVGSRRLRPVVESQMVRHLF